MAETLKKSTSLYLEQLDHMRAHVDHEIMTWVRQHAGDVKVSEAVELVHRISNVCQGHLRDCMDIGINKDQIDAADLQKSAV